MQLQKLFLLLQVLLGSSYLKSQTVLFSENFDSYASSGELSTVAFNNWKQYTAVATSTDWQISTVCTPFSGTRCLSMNDGLGFNCDYAWTDAGTEVAYCANLINASGYVNLTLDFKYYVDGEAGFDYGMVVYSFDGVTWNNVTATQYVDQPAWTSVTSLSMPAALNGTSFYLGFRWTNDATYSGDPSPAWTIDDIVVKGTVPAYKSTWVSMNTGSAYWCAGETRNVTVTVTNSGTSTWTDAAPDVNIGCKWNAEADYFVRVNAGNLASGGSATYTLSMTAPSAGINNLTFDIVKEGDCWFANNNGSCGPGNSVYTSAAISIDAQPVQGSVSNAGPIDFCSSTGDWSASPISVAGATGTIWWQWGTSAGGWSGDWVSGSSPAYTTFPKKVAAVDGNADRVRWYVKSTNGACAPTSYSSAIQLRNHYNENPSSLSSTINNVCSGTAGTLTATFPTATCILGNVEFSTSCGGVAFATVAGNGTTSVSTAFTAPASTTTYYARYNPGTGTGCSPGSCVNTTVTILPPAPATPGAISGTVSQCPNVTGQVYYISAVTNATTYNWTVPTGWSITGGAGTVSITVTTGNLGQNGNITVTAGNSCGTSAAATLAVNTNGCLPVPTQLIFPTTANSYITLSSGGGIVIGNSATNAVMNGGTSGGFRRWIVSEGESNTLKWNIQNNFGTFVIPFGYSSTTYIPMNVSVSAAGTEVTTGSGAISFSTYRTASGTNLPYPTGVANMFGINGGGPLSAVDRFWSIYATGYQTTPSQKPLISNVDFYYDDTEWNNSVNTGITSESNLQAQRYNSTLNTWESSVFLAGTDFPADDATYVGNQSYVGNTGNITSGNLFQWWTLVDKFAPLPVTWLEFESKCFQAELHLRWSTAAENNVSYFTIERSSDGIMYHALANVPATGNSSVIQHYLFQDLDPLPSNSYYRIRETDFNGLSGLSSPILTEPCTNKNISAYSHSGSIHVEIINDIPTAYEIRILDMLGQILMAERLQSGAEPISATFNTHLLAEGCYLVEIRSNSVHFVKKLYVQSAP